MVRVRILKDCIFKNWLGEIISSTGSGKFRVKILSTATQEINKLSNAEICFDLLPSEVDPW